MFGNHSEDLGLRAELLLIGLSKLYLLYSLTDFNLKEFLISSEGCSLTPIIKPPGLLHKLKSGRSFNLTCELNCNHEDGVSYDWIQTLATGESLIISSEPNVYINKVIKLVGCKD